MSCAIYRANVKEKTVAKDAIALIGLGAAAPVTFTATEVVYGTKAKEALAKGIMNFGKKHGLKAVVGGVFRKPIENAVQNCLEDWKKPSEPAQYADWAY